MISSFRNAVSRLHPTVLLLLSYLAAIALGTAALMMPVSTVTGDISLIDALFTATSAICVTGLEQKLCVNRNYRHRKIDIFCNFE
ncbi:MAG: hypothetical protein JW736_04855 [Deltaproteobacteria bacterium]|nr:hypothetical protein [Deltaproteobacteria bacterium]MBN2688156.1 hypothetical protein [Deltaproteobacteria bacterium]